MGSAGDRLLPGSARNPNSLPIPLIFAPGWLALTARLGRFLCQECQDLANNLKLRPNGSYIKPDRNGRTFVKQYLTKPDPSPRIQLLAERCEDPGNPRLGSRSASYYRSLLMPLSTRWQAFPRTLLRPSRIRRPQHERSPPSRSSNCKKSQTHNERESLAHRRHSSRLCCRLDHQNHAGPRARRPRGSSER